MPTVFVSHTTADDRDLDLARKLAQGLRQAGAQVWIAPESVPAGAQWRQEIVSGIMDSCSHFLVILSHASLQSEWVTREIELARTRYDRDHSFVVLQVAMGKLSTPLPDVQQVPYLHEFADQLKAVVKAVGLEPRGFEARKLSLSLARVEPSGPQALDAGWLVYRRRQAALVGRQTELAALRAFYDDNEQFKWWAIEGPGGVGKSRLALESLLDLAPGWYAGFLRASDLVGFDAAKWNPDEPVIIVIDDAAAAPHDKLEAAIESFHRRTGQLRHKVRLLLLERTIDGQPWWDELRAKGEDNQVERIRSLHTGKTLVLGRLQRDTHRAALESFLQGAPQRPAVPLPPERDPFWDHLNTLTDQGRPLFIGIAAAAIAEMGIECLRQWNISDLLQFVYDREMKAWERLCPEAPLRDRVKDVIALATASGGFDFARNEKRLLAHLKTNRVILDDEPRLWKTVATLTSAQNSALEPDILGEFFLTEAWRKPLAGPSEPVTRKLLCAWDLAPSRCAETIARSVSDFPESEAPMWWIEVLTLERFNQDRLRILILHEKAAIGYGKAQQLERMSRLLEALARWSAPLKEFDQVHNHLSTASRFAVETYGASGRWPETRQWLERSRGLARRFPGHINLQRDLAVSALSAIQYCGPARRWDDLDFAFEGLRDVERRHPSMNADALSAGAAASLQLFWHREGLKGLDLALAMLVRLNHLESEIGGREIPMLLANGAYNATQAFGRHGYLGHLIWAFHILEETVSENPGNLDIDSRLKKVRGQAEQIETAREGFELTQQAREAVAEIPLSGPDNTQRVEQLIARLQALAAEHEQNWMLRLYLAKGLTAALAAIPDGNQPERIATLVGKLREIVQTVPDFVCPREWLAAGLAHAAACYRHTTNLDRVRPLIEELRRVVGDIRAEFPVYPVGSILSVGLRAAVSCHVFAGDPAPTAELLDELHMEARRTLDGSIALGLADLLLAMLTFYADSGATDKLGELTSRLLDLEQVVDDGADVDLRVAQGVILTVRAWDRAAGSAQSAALLRQTGGLEQRLEKEKTGSTPLESIWRELRQLRKEHSIETPPL